MLGKLVLPEYLSNYSLMPSTLIVNAKLVNRGQVTEQDLLIKDQRIERIDKNITADHANVIDAHGQLLLPGIIDDQVHFREPGLTDKAEIYTESRAAVAGGITTYMEMPNTVPNTLTQELLQDKYDIAEKRSLANYSFYMGVSNDNIEEVLKTNKQKVCGVKVFMGSSTGNMLVDDEKTLDGLFSRSDMLIAAHCEDEDTIKANLEIYRQRYNDSIPFHTHPEIRSVEACYISSSRAVALAKKHGTRFHVLHISTAKETELFDNSIPLSEKKITAEACTHHLWFCDDDYEQKQALIKWNPAVKSKEDRAAVFQAVLDGRIDVLATDHAPHTFKEKQQPYLKCPSGGPLVQHALPAMMEFYHEGKITLEQMVEKMCHNPAILFDVKDRGYLDEGSFADIVLVDPNSSWRVTPENLYYKCGWSPFMDQTFRAQVTHTFVSGHLAYQHGAFDESHNGMRLEFSR